MPGRGRLLLLSTAAVETQLSRHHPPAWVLPAAKIPKVRKANYWDTSLANGWTRERRARQNAYQGGHWLMQRELSRLVNGEVPETREAVERVRD